MEEAVETPPMSYRCVHEKINKGNNIYALNITTSSRGISFLLIMCVFFVFLVCATEPMIKKCSLGVNFQSFRLAVAVAAAMKPARNVHFSRDKN